MNSLPHKFYNDVVGQLVESAICSLSFHFSGRWASTAHLHYTRRRDLTVCLDPCTEGIKASLFYGSVNLPFNLVLDPRYDRVKIISVGHALGNDAQISYEHLKEQILPMLRKLATGCRLYVSTVTSTSESFYDAVFDGLKDCCRLSAVSLGDSGQLRYEFVTRQIDHGHLKELYLAGTREWPTDIHKSLLSFVKSNNFSLIDLRFSNLKLQMQIVACYFDRFFNGELNEEAALRGKLAFPPTQIAQLHPGCTSIPKTWTKADELGRRTLAGRSRALRLSDENDGSISILQFDP